MQIPRFARNDMACRFFHTFVAMGNRLQWRWEIAATLFNTLLAKTYEYPFPHKTADQLSARKSQSRGAYIATKSVGTYVPPVSYHTDSPGGEGWNLRVH